MRDEWPSADDVAGVGGPVRPVGDAGVRTEGGSKYSDEELDAAIEALAPATRDRIRLVLDADESAREWVREAVARADLAIDADDPIKYIQAAIRHRFRTEVDPRHEQRAEVPIELPAETWAHLRARARSRHQRRDDREADGWDVARSPQAIFNDLVFEYVTLDAVVLVEGIPKTAADAFPPDALEDTDTDSAGDEA